MVKSQYFLGYKIVTCLHLPYKNPKSFLLHESIAWSKIVSILHQDSYAFICKLYLIDVLHYIKQSQMRYIA